MGMKLADDVSTSMHFYLMDSVDQLKFVHGAGLSLPRQKPCSELNRQARAVNTVWNYCNDAQRHALQWGKKWPTGFDLNKLTTGSRKALRLHAGTINRCASPPASCNSVGLDATVRRYSREVSRASL
jgi:hypothetical protein